MIHEVYANLSHCHSVTAVTMWHFWLRTLANSIVTHSFPVSYKILTTFFCSKCHIVTAVTLWRFALRSYRLKPPFKPIGASKQLEWRLQTMGKQLSDLPGQRVKWFPLSLVSVQHGKKDLFTTKYYCEIFEDFCPWVYWGLPVEGEFPYGKPLVSLRQTYGFLRPNLRGSARIFLITFRSEKSVGACE